MIEEEGMSDELKPCPFCGSNTAEVARPYFPAKDAVVECQECFAKTDEYMSDDEAIEAWNRRVADVEQLSQTLRDVRGKLANEERDHAEDLEEMDAELKKAQAERLDPAWEKAFDKEFFLDWDNGPGTTPNLLFHDNGDGTCSLAIPDHIKAFIRAHQALGQEGK